MTFTYRFVHTQTDENDESDEKDQSEPENSGGATWILSPRIGSISTTSIADRPQIWTNWQTMLAKVASTPLISSISTSAKNTTGKGYLGSLQSSIQRLSA